MSLLTNRLQLPPAKHRPNSKGRLNKGRPNKGQLNKARLNKARLNKARLNKARLNKANKAGIRTTRVALIPSITIIKRVAH